MHERAAVRECQLAGREGRREDGRRGVAQHGEVGVVEVERVRGCAIGEGGPHGARASPRAHDGGEGRAALAFRDLLNDPRCRLRGAREHDAHAVENGATRGVHGGDGAVFPAALDDELGDHGGGAAPDKC